MSLTSYINNIKNGISYYTLDQLIYDHYAKDRFLDVSSLPSNFKIKPSEYQIQIKDRLEMFPMEHNIAVDAFFNECFFVDDVIDYETIIKRNVITCDKDKHVIYGIKVVVKRQSE